MHLLRKRARQLRNNTTDAERHLWRQLRLRNMQHLKFRRQHIVAGFITDFASVQARLVIELDGGQHADATEYDAGRTRIIEATGYRVLRFWNHDVLQQTDSVLEVIWKACSERS